MFRRFVIKSTLQNVKNCKSTAITVSTGSATTYYNERGTCVQDVYPLNNKLIIFPTGRNPAEGEANQLDCEE